MLSEVLALLEDPNRKLVKQKRQGQVDLAKAITENIMKGGVLLAEAPVGTGKSYAYSVPAALAKGRRIVIATAKKTLQDQLVEKDLPAVERAIGPKAASQFKFTVLKGKSNYYCERRFQAFIAPDRAKHKASGGKIQVSDDVTRAKQAVATWERDLLKESSYGDGATFPGGQPVYWDKLSVDECVPASCAHRETCGYIKLRELAMEYPVVVTNHHVLAYTLLHGTSHLGEYTDLVVDEAHQLADCLRDMLSKNLTAGEFNRLVDVADDLARIYGFEVSSDLVDVWEEALAPAGKQRGLFDPLPYGGGFTAVVTALEALDRQLRDGIRGVRDSEEGPQPDAQERAMGLAKYQRHFDPVLNAAKALANPTEDYGFRIDPPDDRSRDTTVGVIYINLGKKVGHRLSTLNSTALLSGTLAVDGDFSYVAEELGLKLVTAEEVEAWRDRQAEKEPAAKKALVDVTETVLLRRPARGMIVPTPFNYDRQAVLYTPKHLPLPTYDRVLRPIWVKEQAHEIARIANASHGHMFVLCSAFADINEISMEVSRLVQWPLIIQSPGNAAAAEKRYRRTKNAILFGSRSFFEGVDIQGDKLWCVVIPKLPIPSPEDTVITVKTNRLRHRLIQSGKTEGAATVMAFQAVSVPPMIAAVRQAAGRVIRSVTDVGVVAITDTRVWTGSSKRPPDPNATSYEGYGLKVVRSLGYNNRTAKIENIEAWFNAQRSRGRGCGDT